MSLQNSVCPYHRLCRKKLELYYRAIVDKCLKIRFLTSVKTKTKEMRIWAKNAFYKIVGYDFSNSLHEH